MNDKKQIRIIIVLIIALSIFMLYAAVALLPELVNFSVITYSEIAHLAKPVTIIVMIGAIPFFIVLYKTFKLCQYILSDEIFTNRPLNALNLIFISSMIIFVLFIIVLILFLRNNYFTPLLAVILFLVILSSFIIGIFSKILHILVKRATILKIDSDLTI